METSDAHQLQEIGRELRAEVIDFKTRRRRLTVRTAHAMVDAVCRAV